MLEITVNYVDENVMYECSHASNGMRYVINAVHKSDGSWTLNGRRLSAFSSFAVGPTSLKWP